MSVDDAIKVISALGVGSSIGAMITAIINSNTSKGNSRAEAADLLVGAAERVGKMNLDLSTEVRGLQETIEEMHSLILDFLDGKISREEFRKSLRDLH